MCSCVARLSAELQEIHRSLNYYKECNVKNELKIKLVKYSRGKCHKSGDLEVDFGDIDVEVCKHVHDTIRELRHYVESCVKISSVLVITLNRRNLMKEVIRDVLTRFEKYGIDSKNEKVKRVVTLPNNVGDDSEKGDLNLTFLRRKLLLEHVKRFIDIMGYQLKSEKNSSCDKSTEINSNVGKVDVTLDLNSNTTLLECCSGLIERSTAHKFDTDKIREEKLSKVTDACVKFNLLLSNPQRSIKLDLRSDNLRLIKTPAFVMYNFARLSCLFDKFDQLVQSNYYPPLLQLQDVDLSLLKSEDEWSLIRDYVFWFPCVIEEINTSILDSKSPPCFHKLYHFLVNLSHKVSAYYTTTHVLGDSSPHLLPLMYARLYLLKSIFQIMKNSFDMLDISPLDQM